MTSKKRTKRHCNVINNGVSETVSTSSKPNMYGSPKTLCNFQMQKEQRSKSDLSQTNRRYRIEISTVVYADLHKMIRLSGCNIGARRLR